MVLDLLGRLSHGGGELRDRGGHGGSVEEGKKRNGEEIEGKWGEEQVGASGSLHSFQGTGKGGHGAAWERGEAGDLVRLGRPVTTGRRKDFWRKTHYQF